ncbi:MAG TPA: hypothetical protein VKW78_02130 [Terriglobales bacterium]|nr:hypothetical protein [Terriglobales bacterium]
MSDGEQGYRFQWCPVAGLAMVLCLAISSSAQRQEASGYHAATVVSVRELHSSFPIARWSGLREFTLNFSIKDAGELHCYTFHSIILQDVDSLRASSGQQIKVQQNGDKLKAILSDGRNIKADLAKPQQCPL